MTNSPRKRNSGNPTKGGKHLPETIDGRTGKLAPSPRKIALSTLGDIRREMASVYREARNGTLDLPDAARLAFVLTGIGKLIEIETIEKRIEALEKHQKGR